MESKSILIGIVIGIFVGGIVGYIAAPTPNVSAYEEQMNQLQYQISSLNNEINDLEDQLEQAVSQEEYTQLEEDIAQLQSEVTSLQNQIISKDNIIQSFQSQIGSKDDTIELLQERIEELQNTYNFTPGEWIVIKTWSGLATKTTELFHAPSDQIRISWSLDISRYSSFSISLYEEGEEYAIKAWLFLENQPEGETHAYISPGNYYLDLSVLECEYTVTVEAIIS